METFSALLALCAGNSPVPVNSPHKGQWRGALMFSLICVWINGWINNREAGDLRRYGGHYDAIVMCDAYRDMFICIVMEIPSVSARDRHFDSVMCWVGSRDFFFFFNKNIWLIVDYLGNQIKVMYMLRSHCWYSGHIKITKRDLGGLSFRTRKTSPVANFMGPTWGPPGSYRLQMGPMWAPWTLLSGMWRVRVMVSEISLQLTRFVVQ